MARRQIATLFYAGSNPVLPSILEIGHIEKDKMRVDIITTGGNTFTQELPEDTPREMLEWLWSYFHNWKEITEAVTVDSPGQRVVVNPENIAAVVIVE